MDYGLFQFLGWGVGGVERKKKDKPRDKKKEGEWVCEEGRAGGRGYA